MQQLKKIMFNHKNYRVPFCVLLFLLSTFLKLHSKENNNILWIYLEDVSGWFGCYGETLIETPNIDSLASKGVRFDRFYTPAGVCSATRSAIITGMMQTSIGAHHHRSCRATFRGKDMGEYDKNVLPQGVTPLPILFKKNGYYTFNEGTGKDDFNFEWSSKDFYDRVGGWNFKGAKNGSEWTGRKKNQPFFGQIQLQGGKLGKRAKKIIDPSIVPVPPYYPDIALVRKEIAHHYDCLIETDKEVGRIIAALKRDSLYDNTTIFLFSDHGYKLHRHKQYLYEGGIQMPLIVFGPGINKGVRKDLVSGIDISAASLAAAGIAIPQKMEGLNFLFSITNPMVLSTLVVSKTLLQNNRFIESMQYRAIEDYELWIRTFPQAKSFYIGKQLIKYRVHESNISSDFAAGIQRCIMVFRNLDNSNCFLNT